MPQRRKGRGVQASVGQPPAAPLRGESPASSSGKKLIFYPEQWVKIRLAAFPAHFSTFSVDDAPLRAPGTPWTCDPGPVQER